MTTRSIVPELAGLLGMAVFWVQWKGRVTRPLCGAALLLGCGYAISVGSASNLKPAALWGASLRAAATVATMSGVAVSPDGRYVSVRVERPDLSANTVRLDWYILGVADGAVRGHAGGGTPDWTPSGEFEREQPEWSNDSRWLYFKKVEKGRVEVWRVGLEGDANRVVGNSSDIDEFRLDKESKRIFYIIGPSRSALQRAARRELERGVWLDGTQYIGAPLEGNWPSHAGIHAIRVGRNGWFQVGDDGHRNLMVFVLATGRSHRADEVELREYGALTHPPRERAIQRVVSWSRSGDGGLIAFIAQKGNGSPAESIEADRGLSLGVVMRSHHRVVWCIDPLCRHPTGSVAWRPGTGEFLFTTAHVSGIASTVSWDVSMSAWRPTTNEVRRILEYRGVISGDGSNEFSDQCPVSRAYAVCIAESAVTPPELIRIDLEGGGVRRLFEPNERLSKDLASHGMPERIRYMVWKDKNMRSHSGVLVLPTERPRLASPLPLVITSYWCEGFLQGGSGSTVPEFTLARYGFAVLCTNVDDGFYATGEGEDSHLSAYQQRRMEYMYAGWSSAVDRLAAEGVTARNMVGISGLSFTGETVNYVVTHHPGFAVAATAGHLDMSDPFDYFLLQGMGPVGRQTVRYYGLTDPRTRAGAAMYGVGSDAMNAGRVCSPTLVQTDEGEFQYGLEYYGALQMAKAPVEVIVFPREAHIFWLPQQRMLVEQRNIDWFRFWMKHEVSGDGTTGQRYSRWRDLANSTPARCGRGYHEPVADGRP